MSNYIIDANKVVRLGVRRKDEIRECFFCKKDCRKTYYSEVIDNKKVWICNDCFKKIQKLNAKTPQNETL